jgi:hypothetical protein
VPLGVRLLTYDSLENIASLSFSGVDLKTTDEVDAHFDDLIALWRRRCYARKVYWLVDYEDFRVDLKENEAYVRNMRRVFAETALAIVRYGGTSLTHAAVHLYSLRLHKSSLIYASRNEALEVITRLKAGTLKQEI